MLLEKQVDCLSPLVNKIKCLHKLGIKKNFGCFFEESTEKLTVGDDESWILFNGTRTTATHTGSSG